MICDKHLSTIPLETPCELCAALAQVEELKCQGYQIGPDGVTLNGKVLCADCAQEIFAEMTKAKALVREAGDLSEDDWDGRASWQERARFLLNPEGKLMGGET